MQQFRINKTIKIRCTTLDTPSGFAHSATLYKNGKRKNMAIKEYLNRTWELYRYQSVMIKLVQNNPYLDNNEVLECIKGLQNRIQ